MGESPSDLSSDEQRLLSLLEPLGVDWRSTRAYFQSKYGVSRYRDRTDVVALPPFAIFGTTALQFNIHWDNNLAELPPDYLFADHRPHPDPRENFTEIAAEISRILGPGSRKDVSNCLIHRWQLGVFVVEAMAWPEELQSKEITRSDGTPPELQNQALVIVRSRIAQIFPDPRFNSVVFAILARDSDVSFFSVHDNDSYPHITPDIRYARRVNGAPLALDQNASLFWKQASTRFVGTTNAEYSLLFETDDQIGPLVLTKIRPARGLGGSALSIQVKPAGLNERMVSMFESRRVEGLTGCAAQIAALWNVEVHVEETTDE